MAAQADIQQLIASAISGVAAVGNQNGNSVVTLNNSPILVFTGIVDMNQTIATAVATAVTGVSQAGSTAAAVPSAAPAVAPAVEEKQKMMTSQQVPDHRAAAEDQFDSADDGAALAAAAVGNQNGNSVVTLNNSPILVFTGIVDMNQAIVTALATAVTGVSSSQ